MEDYLTMVNLVRPCLDLWDSPLTPVVLPVDTSKSLLVTPCKYAFTDEDASKNVQAPMQNTIPDALLEMF